MYLPIVVASFILFVGSIDAKKYDDRYDPNYRGYYDQSKAYYGNVETNGIGAEGDYTYSQSQNDPDEQNRFGSNGVMDEMEYRRHKEMYKYGGAPPPPPSDAAKMARYVVHQADWVSLATLSSHHKTHGYPMANIFSVSDGPVDNATGVPYMYVTDYDISVQDLARDPHCSMMFTLAITDYCKKNKYDAEDPRCAHVIFTGKIYRVRSDSEEGMLARNALFSRHPVMKTWPADHKFYFVKMKIDDILVLDYFGGPKIVKVRDYFNVHLDDINSTMKVMSV